MLYPKPRPNESIVGFLYFFVDQLDLSLDLAQHFCADALSPKHFLRNSKFHPVCNCLTLRLGDEKIVPPETASEIEQAHHVTYRLHDVPAESHVGSLSNESKLGHEDTRD